MTILCVLNILCVFLFGLAMVDKLMAFMVFLLQHIATIERLFFVFFLGLIKMMMTASSRSVWGTEAHLPN